MCVRTHVLSNGVCDTLQPQNVINSEICKLCCGKQNMFGFRILLLFKSADVFFYLNSNNTWQFNETQEKPTINSFNIGSNASFYVLKQLVKLDKFLVRFKFVCLINSFQRCKKSNIVITFISIELRHFHPILNRLQNNFIWLKTTQNPHP